jgi:hypothetical protein
MEKQLTEKSSGNCGTSREAYDSFVLDHHKTNSIRGLNEPTVEQCDKPMAKRSQKEPWKALHVKFSQFVNLALDCILNVHGDVRVYARGAGVREKDSLLSLSSALNHIN